MRISRLFWLFLLAAAAGCQSGTLPNPNDPKDVGSLSPDNIRDQLGSISDGLQAQELAGKINDKQYKELMRKAADSLLVGFNPEKIEASRAWQVGDVLITAQHWADAKAILEAAIVWAKMNHSEDRRVNDTLRLARVLAEMDQVPEALKTARTVFDVKPNDGAPILFATYLEIAPAARGKGHDIELADLIEDAIKIDTRVEVDGKSGPGKEFLSMRPYHVLKAWKLIEALDTAAKRPDLAARAMAKAEESSKEFGTRRRVRI